MTYCLPAKHAAKFLEDLKAGKIDPEKLMQMTSEERRAFFEGMVGKEDAHPVNALFESKLLLKDQQAGLVDWAQSVAGLKPKVRAGLVEKIGGMERYLTPHELHGFLADLAEQKLGTAVTEDEAKQIMQGAAHIETLKGAWDSHTEEWASEDARLKYGAAYVEFQDYIGKLKSDANALTFTEWLKSPGKWWGTVAGVTKGIVASMDNSYFGRQGMKMLLTNPDIWAGSFLKSWGDIGKELVKVDAMKPIKADIFSRPNAMNGKYRAGKYALGIDSEEAYPSHLPELIPLLGRVYKASESAFNGAALRMRADYADRLIKAADEAGVDTKDPDQAQGIGALVNAMTGRGNMRMSGATADAINSTFFSIRFLKSNFDTLTMHRLGYGFEAGPGRDFARKKAAENLLKIAGSIASILTTASLLWPGSVDPDPRSANFGKIKIGATRFDVTGGMGSLVTLASRLIPTMHQGHWGLWSKSATTGKWTDLHSGKYGKQTALDVIESFWEGKLAPLSGALRDAWKGRMFDGEKATPAALIRNLLTPMPVQTFEDLESNPRGAPILAAMLLDALGISSNTYSAPKKAAGH
jgi:hypothetical protein